METGTSYFSVRDEQHVERDLERFADAGLDAILHTFSERDQQYYEGTMADIVDASHNRGFTVYVNPWGVGNVFGGEALTEFVARNPHTRQVLSTGDRVPNACFNHPDFREFMRDWTRDASGLGADVLFWDEPHWYISHWTDDGHPDDAWSCRCEHCQERYEDEYGESMPERRTDSVVEFREDSMVDFLEEMMALAREEGAENAVCLLPMADADHGLRDWEQLAASPHLDVIATDPYWDVFEEMPGPAEFVGDAADRVATLADEYDLRSQIWIQGFFMDDDPDRLEEVHTATRTAMDSGVDSVFMWGYDGCRSISFSACEDPVGVWNAFLEELD